MKRWQIIVLILVFVAAVVSGCTQPATEPTTEPTTELTLEPTIEPISLEGLDCLVEIHVFAGSGGGNDFEPYKYYAIRDSGMEQVDVETVRLIAPEMLDPSRFDFENEETNSWFAQLMYAPQVENYDSEGFMYRNDYWVPTDFEEKVRIYYSEWGAGDSKAEPEIEQVMLQAAYALFTEDLEKYRAGNELAWPLTSFMVTANGDTIFIEDGEDSLYRPMPDGSLQLLMEMPDDMAKVSYFWFPPR